MSSQQEIVDRLTFFGIEVTDQKKVTSRIFVDRQQEMGYFCNFPSGRNGVIVFFPTEMIILATHLRSRDFSICKTSQQQSWEKGTSLFVMFNDFIKPPFVRIILEKTIGRCELSFQVYNLELQRKCFSFCQEFMPGPILLDAFRDDSEISTHGIF